MNNKKNKKNSTYVECIQTIPFYMVIFEWKREIINNLTQGQKFNNVLLTYKKIYINGSRLQQKLILEP